MNRRHFVKLCAATATAVTGAPEALATTSDHHVLFDPVQLVTPDNAPLRTTALETGETYLFFFPHVTTPCFLMDLGKPVTAPHVLKTHDGATYSWPGGVGNGRSIVSFSAICAHRMSHPTPQISFINYRHSKIDFTDKDDELQSRSRLIYCCSEGSVYDPGDGARVLGGPAPQPLATILLEHHSSDDTLNAYGVLGGNMFIPYFEKFWHRLELSFGASNIRDEVSINTTVIKLSDFTNSQVLC
ncbi:MAG TPA: hypothetical protein EYQ32_14795 [Gammaproteobacteria bacterium]|nr:hypothetical protein [Gammaproteobacteria bacterium]